MSFSTSINEQHTPPAVDNSSNGNIRIKSRQREQIISHISTMKSNIASLQQMSLYELDVKLSLLDRQLQTFEKIQSDLETLDESQFSETHRYEFEEAYVQLRSTILERMDSLRVRTSESLLSSTNIMHTASNNQHRPHLPTLQLSKFNGDHKDWHEFFNMFCMLVDDNPDLPVMSKFQYLKSCLTDSAARLIQSLEMTPQNYHNALHLLKARYENKRHLFEIHLRAILEVQRVTNPSVASLRLFIDNINSSLRALESIATKSQISDGILLFLLTSKLDPELQTKWEDKISVNQDESTSSTVLKLPTWEELAKFLEGRCKALEIFESNRATCSREQQLHGRSTHQTNKFSSSRINVTSHITSNYSPKCIFCSSAPSHSAFRCTQFNNMSVAERFKVVKQLKLCLNCLGINHIATSCPSQNRCQDCGSLHHTLLHKNTTPNLTGSSDQLSQPQLNTALNIDSEPSHSFKVLKEGSRAILATAMVEVQSSNGASVIGRALLDSGSQSNFITERMAQHLRLPRKKINLRVTGIGDVGTVCVKHICTVTAKSLTSGFAPTFDAIILSSISSHHPQTIINTQHWKLPSNIKLADTSFNVPGPIDLLMGVDLFWDLLMIGKIKFDNQPNLIKTKLGWIVTGSDGIRVKQSSPKESTYTSQASFLTHNLNLEKSANEKSKSTNSKYNKFDFYSPEPLLDNLLEAFWKLEHVEQRSETIMSPEEAACEQFFNETTKRCPISDKFIVRLPFKVYPPTVCQSFPVAMRRFAYLESRFARDESIRTEYSEFMEEYENLRHMSPIQAKEALYYIPHHCVVKPDSSTTRLRVVFDASAATSNGKSLNDMLKVGPTLQDDVFTIISRFRYNKVVLVADITKMYRQVLVDQRDAKWQCVLWRKNKCEPFKSYKLNTITYGTSCAPYLAVKCLQQLAHDEAINYPVGARVTLKDFYVDNLMTGGETIEEVLEIRRQVTELLLRGGFPLRKFASNNEKVLEGIAESDRESIIDVENMQYIKTLGLKWSPSEDVFSFSYPKHVATKISKRSILSHMASFFDPIGLINPIIVRCKMLMQELWKLKLHWDESVPLEVYSEWKLICDELNSINLLKIPRLVKFNKHTNIHIFVDASTRAYGACVYAVTNDDYKSVSNLICAKSRVAPTKEVSLPRLELCAALLGSQLIQSVRKSFPTSPNNIFCWSDSTITLSWIAGDPSRWPSFVANRVTKIQTLTAGCKWRHIPSELNPADLLSRGTTVNGLERSTWFKGPEFLTNINSNWPKEYVTSTSPEVIEVQTLLLAVPVDDIISTHKFVNNFERLVRTFVYINRFIEYTRRKQSNTNSTSEVEECNRALLSICKIIQIVSFRDVIKKLENNKAIDSHSKLRQLSPFLHDGVLRVGGRLKNSSLPFSTKHPLLLPSGHPFVRTLILHFHIKNLHAGVLTLQNILREQYWIINSKNVIKQIVHNCIRCYRCRPLTESQIMGSLPKDRVEQSYPFQVTGVDFCGPFLLTSRIRGRAPTKVYLSVFICFSTKAVHLELVPDLTSAAFISALKRFISRRGCCHTIYSDNATNFIGSSRELRELLKSFLSEDHNAAVRDACRENGIIWKFIPPRSPHFGGLWESAVKQAKHYIRRTIGYHILSHDEFHTVCCQIEAIINSRPLTPLSSDPNDLRPLTPAHFLIGRPLTSFPEPTLLPKNTSSLKKYQLVQWIQQQFWDRWRNEYLKVLQQKSKWTKSNPNLKVNDLVLLKEENIPPLKWPLARVVNCNPGDDKMVRVVTVKTADGTFKRAVTKLCKLPIET